MSHFTVAVFTDDAKNETIESALAPFQENNMGDCPEQYLEFNDHTDEVREGWEKLTVSEANEYTNIADYAISYHGFGAHPKDSNRFGYWENPNAKWDWYAIGGRWQGLLIVQSSASLETTESGDLGLMTEREANELAVSSCLIKDLDFEAMAARQRQQRRETWQNNITRIEEVRSEHGEDSDEYQRAVGMAKFLWGYDGEKSEDEYVSKASGTFSTFAVLYDGKWGEKGSMGWWGMVSDEKEPDDWQAQFDAVLAEASKVPTMRITIVDAHI